MIYLNLYCPIPEVWLSIKNCESLKEVRKCDILSRDKRINRIRLRDGTNVGIIRQELKITKISTLKSLVKVWAP